MPPQRPCRRSRTASRAQARLGRNAARDEGWEMKARSGFAGTEVPGSVASLPAVIDPVVSSG